MSVAELWQELSWISRFFLGKSKLGFDSRRARHFSPQSDRNLIWSDKCGSGPSAIIVGGLVTADTVEKLEKNGGLLFCRKPKHSELLKALGMLVHQ